MFDPNVFDQNYFLTPIIFDPKNLRPKFFWIPKYSKQNFFWTQILFDQKISDQICTNPKPCLKIKFNKT